jgi:putative membrane protein
MILDAALAYLHFISIFLLFTFLAIELVLLRSPLDADKVQLLGRVDMFYGIAAGLVLVSGLLRVFVGAKGGIFYTGNPIFWIKFATFIVVGALSVPPTLRILRWNRELKANAASLPDDADRVRQRRYVMWEIHLLVFIPLFAVLMARGIGL